ncbi:MAG: hypothetical protein DWQ31_05450 [Planctomycetota bacterium]|nr:MAG: hypothetical protein DWQ31_05450 [Planctomycetota bacterium]
MNMLGARRRSFGSRSWIATFVAMTIAVTALGSSPLLADDPTLPDLIYQVSSGNVTVDPTDSGTLIGYELNSNDEFLPGNFTPVLTAGVSTANTGELSEASLTALTTPGSIGQVLPAWLTESELDALFTTRNASTALGQPLVPFDLILQLPTTVSNASFDTVGDQDILNLDFGTVNPNATPAALGITIANVAPAGDTARLDLLSVTGSGDTGVLTTNVTPFTDLDAGSSLSFEANMVDTSSIGSFSASYDLDFSDLLGTSQTLTINLTGDVALFDDPTMPDLIYNSSTGDVTIDPTDSGTVLGYVLQSNDEFLPGNFTPALSGGLFTARTDELSEASLTALTTPTSIGSVFPTGLDVNGVLDLLTTNTVSTALGSPTVNFDIEVVSCSIVGDANCDGFVDILGDILPAFTSFTGPGSFGKTRAEGDVHGTLTGATPSNDPHDGDVDVSDVLTIFGAFTGPPPDEGGLGPPAAAGDPSIPDLIYDPTTGEVVLDPDGSSIIGYSLQNATNSFLPGNHTPILAGVTTALTSQLEEAALAPGSGSIGLVFPTGLDLAGLQALLTVNQVSRSLGAPLVPFDLVVLSSGPVVPEPTTLTMFAVALATLAVVARHRGG